MNCVKVEVAVLGSPSLIVLMVFVDVKQHWTWTLGQRNEEAPQALFPQCVTADAEIEVLSVGNPVRS